MDDPSEAPVFISSFSHHKVALTMIGVLGLIITILAWKPQVSLPVGILLVLVVLIGIMGIKHQVGHLMRVAMAKKVLPLRLEEGQALFDDIRQSRVPQVTEEELRNWNELTENNLRQYVDELHVARFRFAGHEDVPYSFTTYRLEAKLRFLDALLEQLKD